MDGNERVLNFKLLMEKNQVKNRQNGYVFVLLCLYIVQAKLIMIFKPFQQRQRGSISLSIHKIHLKINVFRSFLRISSALKPYSICICRADYSLSRNSEERMSSENRGIIVKEFVADWFLMEAGKIE